MSEPGGNEAPAENPVSAQSRLAWFFAISTLLFLALWAWTELRLQAEREITRSVEAEKNVLEGETQRLSVREQLRGRRTGIALSKPLKVSMTSADEGATTRGRVYLDAGSGRVFGFFEGMDASRPGMTYQLWFQPVGGAPGSVGTVEFDEEGDGVVAASGFPPNQSAGQFVLTLEQSGGALVPTGPDVLRGELAPADRKAAILRIRSSGLTQGKNRSLGGSMAPRSKTERRNRIPAAFHSRRSA